MKSNSPRNVLTALLALLGLTASVQAQVPIDLHPNDTVAFCGDASPFAEIIGAYLSVCQPGKDIQVQVVTGQQLRDIPGEAGDLVLYPSPNVVVMCFGLRGGNMQKSTPELLANFRQELLKGIRKFKDGGVRSIILTSPTALDPDVLNASVPYQEYCTTLTDIKKVTAEVARQQQVSFVDIYTPTFEAVQRAKQKFGATYRMTGPDMVFPTANSAIVIAHSLLKAFGCDGNIGQITLDMASGTATATAGHRVISSDKTRLEIESTKYPYCFGPFNVNDPGDPRRILAFVPFDADLNRYTLMVKNPPVGNLLVTWGGQKKEYPAEILKRGINLAAEFPTNPFLNAFGEVTKKVDARKTYLGYTIGRVLGDVNQVERSVPGSRDACEQLRKAIRTQWELQRRCESVAAPVRHVLSITSPKAPSK